MDKGVIWGAMMVIYIAPFAAWMMARFSYNDARPDSPDKKAHDERTHRICAAWIGGMLLMLLIWGTGGPPEAALLILCFTLSCVGIGLLIRKRRAIFANKTVRAWLAGSALWLLSVVAWRAAFGRNSHLEDNEFLVIITAPVLISAIGLALWRWVNKK
jgi:ABC-type Fe3+-siderophore transport system permease subunit